MGKRTNLFEINETLAIRKCTKKVFFWYHFSILLFSVFGCVWLGMGNFTTLVIHGLWIPKKIVKENSCNIVSLPGWYSQTAKSGVNEKLWYQLPACWSFPPSVAQPGRQQAPHLRLQAVAPSSWFQSPPGWRQLLADLANLATFHFIQERLLCQFSIIHQFSIEAEILSSICIFLHRRIPPPASCRGSFQTSLTFLATALPHAGDGCSIQ